MVYLSTVLAVAVTESFYGMIYWYLLRTTTVKADFG